MSYPRNAASPERIAVGAVVQISDGAVQTSGVSISVRGQGGASGAGGGTTAYDNGIVEYTPTQGETDFTSFVVVAYKTGCIPACATVVTQATSTPGRVVLSDGVAHGGTLGSSTATLALSRLTIASQSSNTTAFTITGNGSGHGIDVTGGSTGNGGYFKSGTGATGNGIEAIAQSTNGQGILATGTGDKAGIRAENGGSGGAGIEAIGSGTGDGIYAISGSGATGSGIRALSNSTNGDGLTVTGTGTGNGILATGGAGASGDGIHAAAGGGVPIRGDVTGNITGNLSGSVGSVTGAVGSVTGNVGGNVAGSVASVTAGVTVTTNNDKTGYALSATGSAALTEGYRADGATGTLGELLYEIIAHLGESSISGTTKTVKKIDGSTTAATFTLNDATTPTSITRAS